MVELKSIGKAVTPDVRTDAATKAIADRLEAQQRRIYQSVGTVQTVMHILNSKFDEAGKDDELTPLWPALLLATETLEDVAGQLEASVVFEPNSSETRTAIA